MTSIIVEAVKAVATLDMVRKLARVAAVGFASALGAIAARRLTRDDQPRRRK